MNPRDAVSIKTLRLGSVFLNRKEPAGGAVHVTRAANRLQRCVTAPTQFIERGKKTVESKTNTPPQAEANVGPVGDEIMVTNLLIVRDQQRLEQLYEGTAIHSITIEHSPSVPAEDGG